MNTIPYLTRKQLCQETGARSYQISYLTDNNRLPLIRPSRGHGYPNLYHPDAVEILKEYLQRSHIVEIDESR
jgi:hypothetical protein